MYQQFLRVPIVLMHFELPAVDNLFTNDLGYPEVSFIQRFYNINFLHVSTFSP